MTLRILGGTLRGRRLLSPKSSLIRPTTAVVRKSLFDICQEMIDGAEFLDLFAGSGAMGIEALSRGAKHVTFVDRSPEAIRCVEENLHLFKIEKQATLLKGDAFEMLRRLEKRQKAFDIIYIDPPYGETEYPAELLRLLDTLYLAKKATIFIEEAVSRHEREKPEGLKHLRHKDSRRFGRAILHQYIY
jgi:16S rRNA (guanine966-N2)-methyltransferase